MKSESQDERSSWHVSTPEAALSELGCEPDVGLSDTEAAERCESYGPNEIRELTGRTPLRMFGAQFADFMILVLLAAAVVSGVVGDVEDTIAIVVIVVLNALIGSIQEYRADRAVATLRQMAAPEARVLRSGVWSDVPAREVVPGDIMRLEAGCVVTADQRLIDVADLRIDEAPLTGESETIRKDTAAIEAVDAPLGDRQNMAYCGTLVTGGRGSGVVVATGMGTELGRIAALLHSAESVKTPLQIRLARFGRTLAIGVLVVCALLFSAGVLRGEDVLLMFLTAVTLAVAAIPEALPAVVTVSLALGARKMVQRKALIRKLPAVEGLGSVTFICADKTGTLSQNRMRADAFFVDERRRSSLVADATAGSDVALLARALALNNDAARDAQSDEIRGEPTEIALLEAAEATGLSRPALEAEFPRIGELPFDSDRKRMTTLHRSGGGAVAFVKGAPEVVIARCRVESIDVEAVLSEAERMAAEGYRVLAFSYREFIEVPMQVRAETLECDLKFLGLVALFDAPREGVASSVALCQSAGITPVMITGDHPGTARALAARLGIAPTGADVLTGSDLLELAPEELRELVHSVRVYARVSPEQKIDIVRALQASGEFVAMTGDGVNDAPALKGAEIGVAMGRSGTEVAREAADIVLLDDDFSTIVTAVREGRRVFDNIRKFIKYTMTSNSGEIWTLFLAPFLGLPIPLLPIQILWINLVTDGLPGLALAVEPEERGLMQRPPRPADESIFAHGMGAHILWIGLLIAALSIGGQHWAYAAGSESWRSVVFTVLTLCQLAHVLAIRSDRESILSIGLLSNMPLFAAVILTVLLQLAVVYTPFLQQIFETSALSARELAVCFLLPMVVVIAVELEKFVARRRDRDGSPKAA
jgi:Ca2+-transporting ATPase